MDKDIPSRQNGVHDQDPEITKLLANFVANTTFDLIPADVTHWLQLLLLDYIGVATFGGAKTESSEPFLNAIRALYPETQTRTHTHVNGHSNGHPARSTGSSSCTNGSTVLSRGPTDWPRQAAALLNGAFAHSLDFDDTNMAGVVHPGATVISAALAEGEQTGADGRKFLTALAVGYEVVNRVALGLRAGGFEQGFHNTATAGIFGAIAAISKLRDLDAAQVANAFGLGGSKAAGSMQYLQNGAWNKRLHPGFAAHDAFFCVALTQAGVLGAEKAIEGQHGFLRAYSSRTPTDPKELKSIVDGLGIEWVLKGTAVKPYPACRCAHPGIDLAGKMRLSPRNRAPSTNHSENAVAAPHITSLRLDLSPSFHNLVGPAVPNKIHPQNIVDAQFSAYYQTAVAWLYGAQNGWSVYDHLRDAAVHSLSERITVRRCEDLTPNPLNTRLTVKYVDGGEESVFLPAPLGEPENPMPESVIYAKFASLVQPVLGEEIVRRIEDVVGGLDKNGTTVNDLTNLF